MNYDLLKRGFQSCNRKAGFQYSTFCLPKHTQARFRVMKSDKVSTAQQFASQAKKKGGLVTHQSVFFNLCEYV